MDTCIPNKLKKTTHIRWQCVLCNNGCKGTLVTDLGSRDPTENHQHDHAPDITAQEIAKSRGEMRRRAVTSADPPNRIYSEELANLSDAAKAMMHKVETCKRSIRRNRTSEFPEQPANLADLVIAHTWTHNSGLNQERFLLHDNGADSDSRLIVFATDSNLRLLAAADKWFMDGEFAMAPPNFLQIYVIHIPLGDTTVPVVYAFMQRKSEDTYTELFQTLSDSCDNLGVSADPDTVTIDFEIATKNALCATFGQYCRVKYCFYHLT